MKIEDAAEVMRHVIAHCIEGGSFRTFIYERLGFGPEAYVPMYEVGGMQFTNACPINMSPENYPHFAWAGVGTVIEVGDDIKVQFEDSSIKRLSGDLTSTAEKGPGAENIKVGDLALVVYLSSSSGRKFVLPIGTNFAAWDVAEKLEK